MALGDEVQEGHIRGKNLLKKDAIVFPMLGHGLHEVGILREVGRYQWGAVDESMWALGLTVQPVKGVSGRRCPIQCRGYFFPCQGGAGPDLLLN